MNGDGGLDSLTFNTTGRYVKLALSERGTPDGVYFVKFNDQAFKLIISDQR